MDRDEARKEFEDIARSVRDYLEFLRSAGIWGLGKVNERVEGAAPAQSSADLNKEVEDCKRCSLHKYSRKVAGMGAATAGLMFVGGTPTLSDMDSGTPFSGEAGELFDKILSAMTLRRDEVYLSLALKCRNPEGGMPLEEELAGCRELLDMEIESSRPGVIIALGAVACLSLLGSSDVKTLRGRFHLYNGVKVMPTWSPEDLLKNEGLKKEAWDDLKLVLKEIKGR